MLRVRYLSDIHLELLHVAKICQIKRHIRAPDADEIMILAGDIGNPYKPHYEDFLSFISARFCKTFVIAGNHEYYTNKIAETKKQIAAVCRKFPNITFLDNSTEDYHGFRFIGTTLWTNITKPQYTINDTVAIVDFTPEKYNVLHHECVDFLEGALFGARADEIPAVVITHHLPIAELTHPRFLTPLYANYHQWFCAGLNDLLEKNGDIVRACVFGHTHTPTAETHYGIPFFCNPVGYVHENDINEINESFELFL